MRDRVWEYSVVDLELSGLSVVVTGGSSGIGLATARLLLAEGAKVTICGRDPDRLSAAEAEVGSAELLAVPADVLDPVQAAGLVSAALERWGKIDGVGAIAGRGRPGGLLEMNPSDVAGDVSDKLVGFLNIVTPAVPALIDTSGRIVGLTAPAASRPDPRMGAVSAGRAALENAMKSLAAELAPKGVRVNAVGVGLVDTPRQESRHSDSGSAATYSAWLTEQARNRSVPLGRPGTAVEVAAAICWLLSPMSGYTTGAVLDVTGGC